MRFDCAGASGSRVRPSRKSQRNTETAACKPTRFRMTFFNEKMLKMTSKGRPGGCRKAGKIRSKFDAASRFLFFRKRVPKGSPGGTQLSSFWCLLVAFWLTFSTSASLGAPLCPFWALWDSLEVKSGRPTPHVLEFCFLAENRMSPGFQVHVDLGLSWDLYTYSFLRVFLDCSLIVLGCSRMPASFRAA